MIENLKAIAQQIANSRTRLAHPLQGKQECQYIIDEAKRIEHIETTLLQEISRIEDILKNLLGDS